MTAKFDFLTGGHWVTRFYFVEHPTFQIFLIKYFKFGKTNHSLFVTVMLQYRGRAGIFACSSKIILVVVTMSLLDCPDRLLSIIRLKWELTALSSMLAQISIDLVDEELKQGLSFQLQAAIDSCVVVNTAVERSLLGPSALVAEFYKTEQFLDANAPHVVAPLAAKFILAGGNIACRHAGCEAAQAPDVFLAGSLKAVNYFAGAVFMSHEYAACVASRTRQLSGAVLSATSGAVKYLTIAKTSENGVSDVKEEKTGKEELEIQGYAMAFKRSIDSLSVSGYRLSPSSMDADIAIFKELSNSEMVHLYKNATAWFQFSWDLQAVEALAHYIDVRASEHDRSRWGLCSSIHNIVEDLSCLRLEANSIEKGWPISNGPNVFFKLPEVIYARVDNLLYETACAADKSLQHLLPDDVFEADTATFASWQTFSWEFNLLCQAVTDFFSSEIYHTLVGHSLKEYAVSVRSMIGYIADKGNEAYANWISVTENHPIKQRLNVLLPGYAPCADQEAIKHAEKSIPVFRSRLMKEAVEWGENLYSYSPLFQEMQNIPSEIMEEG